MIIVTSFNNNLSFLAASLAISLEEVESLSQGGLLENIAILRYTVGERLRLEME